MDISVVIPAFNEEENVALLHGKVSQVLQRMGRPYEILFVDDGSVDNTFAKLQAIADHDRCLRIIKFRKNFGQTAALSAGFKAACGEVVVAMDADLQNEPEDIPRLVEQIERGYDCVSGWRKDRKDSLAKRFISRGANLLRKIIIRDQIHDSGCTLKAYRRTSLQGLELYGEMHRFIPALLQWQGYRISEIEVQHHPRRYGKTKYNIIRVIKGLLDMIVVNFWMRFSARPMHLFGGLGFLMGFIGFFLAAYLTVLKIFFGHELANRPLLSLAVLLIILGVQFAIFGIIADIMIKVYFSKEKIAPYNIEQVVNLGQPSTPPPLTAGENIEPVVAVNGSPPPPPREALTPQ